MGCYVCCCGRLILGFGALWGRALTIRPEFPLQFSGLFEPHRFKVGKGGRGGMKSYAFADALLIEGVRQFERVLCAREDMNTIEESVHHLLEARIFALGLQGAYSIEKRAITGPMWEGRGRTEFIFKGLRHNVHNIKGLEGVTKVWVEEAAAVSKDSWTKLEPTIRWEDKARGRQSEIWLTYNPEQDDDFTHQYFFVNPPPDTLLVETSYLDNPWLPEVLRVAAETMLERDPVTYRNVWLGETISSLSGAIFSREMAAADESDRLGSWPVDRTKPVYTFWDLGFGDDTAIWFAQALGGWYHLIDYEEGNGKTIHDYMVILNQRGYMYGAHWLPWDGIDAMLHHKMTGDKSRSVEQLMRESCGAVPVRITPKMSITDQLNAARTIFPQVRIDRHACAPGIKSLRNYQWPPKNAAGVIAPKPLHNWASHASSAFCNLAVSIKQPKNPPPPSRPREEVEYSAYG